MGSALEEKREETKVEKRKERASALNKSSLPLLPLQKFTLCYLIEISWFNSCEIKQKLGMGGDG